MAKAPVARNAPRAKAATATAAEPARAPEKEPKPVPVKAEAEGAAEPRRIDMSKPYCMVWHNEMKHYYQDGVIFDKVYKTEIKV